ncbi:MAG: hypothetical protein IPK71_32245 [Myxococcales bacterium]|nr:hypothetical protein [Myxococcales bacterium]
MREEPIVVLDALGRALLGRERFGAAWASLAVATRPLREAIGPVVLGHLADAMLAVATAGFVDTTEGESSLARRLGFQAGGAGLLVGLEVLQGPLGFGTFDPWDVVTLLLSAGVVVGAREGMRRRAALV